MSVYDRDNIFAKILRGEVPSHKVYEDDHSFAFLDIMPRTLGHALVIPKTPARNILDVPAEALCHTILTVQRTAKAAKAAFAADGITLSQFSEQAGGQVVFHLHFHVLPRFHGAALLPAHTNIESNETLAQKAAKLRTALAEIGV